MCARNACQPELRGCAGRAVSMTLPAEPEWHSQGSAARFRHRLPGAATIMGYVHRVLIGRILQDEIRSQDPRTGITRALRCHFEHVKAGAGTMQYSPTRAAFHLKVDDEIL